MWQIMVTLIVGLHAAGATGVFLDISDQVGLGPEVLKTTGPIARVCFADVNSDGWPDVVVDRHRVFLNVPGPSAPIGRRFDEVPANRAGLLPPVPGTTTVFADVDNDGHLDAIVAEYVAAKNRAWVDHGRSTGWQRGRGDGTFEDRRPLGTQPRTTIAIAVADVNRDGALDLYLGNASATADSHEGFANDLLLNDGHGSWVREPLPEDEAEFDEERDAGGRPTYGAMIMANPLGEGVMILELGYGRRWNRAWIQDDSGLWRDVAPGISLDGDGVRHGRYPEWLKERAKEDSRFDRTDEKPFRANGNTFDCAAGDLDNDGDFDLLFSEITHGWAGESSDRTRLLLNVSDQGDSRFFVPPGAGWSLDRHHADPQRWNQGDLFCELADLDQDGRLDVIVSSGDYPDDQRLRIWLQAPGGGGLVEATETLGINHDGSQQISLADVDGDGDLDLLVGQSFNRYPAEKIGERSPRIRLFENRATDGRKSITLRLHSDGKSANRDALGARVKTRVGDTMMMRQLVGIGGHAGKQHDFIIHFGLGQAESVDELIVNWPAQTGSQQKFANVAAGRYELTQGGNLLPVGK